MLLKLIAKGATAVVWTNIAEQVMESVGIHCPVIPLLMVMATLTDKL